ncbi:hypothetical protein ABXN37_19830 [Piscinibacter sakaiensis]|uniref:Uncharacterized protein n=1 Tax=Piscinibacter sakaiensis TaxID=1547922 RepID=A0A0K8P596_PISS1|nr:hypothetical protein [Piscinibacter sakaiensis]GAP37375.1 hypothetical protein ISF6_3230 [Piscinibacter sakaiensis]
MVAGVCGTAFRLVDAEAAHVLRRYGARIARSCATSRAVLHALDLCRRGRAVCLEGPDGVVIASLEVDPGNRCALHILLAASEGRPGAFRRAEPDIAAIAADIGAAEIRFDTDRPGWVRLLGPQWHRRGDTFFRSI